jgi:hypothetical protein
MRLIALTAAVGLLGVVFMVIAVVNERRMHQYRQPGVTYAAATFRRDGGWRRAELFTEEGLAFQRKAARNGVIGGALWIVALFVYVILGWLAARP